ncbi:MAG: MmcQ protein, partial [Lachnospiraceae bacterium]|nr:MmcQ protein [Lachnospiraceae bacterium]
IYMYVAAPYSSILYKCKAIEVDIPYQYSDENLTLKQAMKLELLKKYESGVWSFEKIKEFGVYAVRGPRNMPAELKREMEAERKIDG